MKRHRDGKQVTFHIVAATVYYRKEGIEAPQQRTVNVITDTDGPITQDDLQAINQECFRRLHVENGVTNDNLLDIVINNISSLGKMTRETFLGSRSKLAQEPAQGVA